MVINLTRMSPLPIWLSFLWLLGCAVGVAAPPSESAAAPPSMGPKSATILIIRHAEKTGDEKDLGLAPEGQKRAAAYADYFANFSSGGRKLRPTALFATERSKHSDRPRLTLQPLADRLHLPVNADYPDKQVDALVQELRSGRHDQSTCLICWHYQVIPELITLLGGDPAALLGPNGWPATVFGWVVILQYDDSGRLMGSSVINEKLLPGDTTDPPVER